MLAALLALGCRMATSTSDAERAEDGIPPLTDVYLPTPTFLAGLGMLPGAMALADLDGDGWRDLIVAGGNDLSPQPLVVYRNDRSGSAPALPRYPSWYSKAIEHHGGLAVGDIDGDGLVDVAVAVPFDRYRRRSSGSVKIYLNHPGSGLPPEPTYEVSTGFQALAVALGDVNGDGRLDLAVAGVSYYAHEDGQEPEPAPQRLHLNRGGRLEAAPSWTTEKSLAAASVAFADVNQDGMLDLVLGAQRVEVYYGRGDGDGTTLLRTPDWSSEETLKSAFGLDVGRLAPGDHTLSIVTADNCRLRACTASRVLVHRPSEGPTVRATIPADNASKVLLVDGNGDERLDLILAQFGGSELGARLRFLPGTGRGFEEKGRLTSTLDFVGTALAAGDLRRTGIVSGTHAGLSSRAVITLPHRQVEGIAQVTIDGVASSDWCWTPGSDWLTLGPEARRGEQVRVRYSWSSTVDVVAGATAALGANTALFFSYHRPASKPERPSGSPSVSGVESGDPGGR